MTEMQSPDAGSVPPQLSELLRRIGDEVPEFNAEYVQAQIQQESDELIPTVNLREMESQLWEHYSGLTLVDPGRLASHHMAMAWLANVYRQTHATFALVDLHLADAAGANTRAAIEHTVYLALLEASPEADVLLEVLESRSRSALTAVMNETVAGGEASRVFATLFQQLPALERRPQDEWILRFEQACSRLEGGAIIYAWYRMLSSSIHTGMLSAAPYLLESMSQPEAPFSLIPMTIADGFLLSWTLISCVWAGWTIDKLLNTDIFGSAVAPIALRMDISPLKLLE
jgi:hypothetical protein